GRERARPAVRPLPPRGGAAGRRRRGRDVPRAPRAASGRGVVTVLDLSAEELLTTTRAVRHRLDLDRPVDPALLRRCVEIALQAPSGRNEQGWNFVIVTEPQRRAALAELWRRGLGQGDSPMSEAALRRAYRTPGSMEKVWSGLRHLGANLHRAPALVVPCIEGRTDGLGADRQASRWASLLPAVWSFMLAARLHGLGTVWTTGNMAVE